MLRFAPGVRLLAVVKEDAYGHGAPGIARALAPLAAGFAVSTPGQGAALRVAGSTAPILLLGPLDPAECAAAGRARLTPSLLDEHELPRLRVAGGRLEAHVKFDTGMGRLGVPPARARALASALLRRGVRRVRGAYTHLAAAAEPRFTAAQLDRFDACLGALRAAGIAAEQVHAANSGAVVSSARARAYGTVRPGLLLYGYAPGGRAPFALRSALAWGCRIAAVRAVPAGTSVSYGHTFVTRRPSRLAVLPVGYAAGLHRALSGRGAAVIRGRRAPFRGLVCMNLTVADVTDVPGAAAGGIAHLIGGGGTARLGADEVARRAGTIAYEVLCAAGVLNPRRPR